MVRSGSPGSRAPGGAPGLAPAGTVLKIAADGDISDVDLHMTTHYLNRVVLLNVYDMLFALGEDMGPRPSLVDKYTVSPDGLVYTLTLRRGVKFHSGKTLDAKDVVYSLTKMQNQGAAVRRVQEAHQVHRGRRSARP